MRWALLLDPEKGSDCRDVVQSCLVYRLPLYYSWSRDNGPIPEKAVDAEEGRVLLIPNAQLEDSGNYTCRVERGTRASDVKTLSLIVEGARSVLP